MENRRNFLIHLLAFYLNWGIISYLFRIIFRAADTDFINYIFYVFILVIICMYIVKSKISRIKYFLLITFAWLLMCGITLFITPRSFVLIPKSLTYSIFNVLITIFLFLQVDSISKLEKALIPYIYLGLIYGIFQWLEYNKEGVYSMPFSYSIMIPALLSLTQFFSKKKWRYFIFFILFTIVNLRIGSRGSFLCFVITFLFIFVIFGNIKKVIFLLSILLPIGILVFVNLQNLFVQLKDIFPDSRTIELFAKGDFLYLAGRDKYYDFVIDNIVKSPLQIRGLYSDRIYLADYFNRSKVTDIMGSYAHNFFLEVLFQFGIWGIPFLQLLICAVFKSVRIVKVSDSTSLRNLYIVFASYCIGQLLFSSSYLTAISFGCYAGIITLILLRRKTYYRSIFPEIISREG